MRILQYPAFFYRNAIVVLIITAAILLLLSGYSDIDVRLADYYFDKQQHIFPWRDAWFTNAFAHGWLKHLIVELGIVFLLTAAADAVLRFERISALNRLRLRFVAATALLIPICISLMKHVSFTHCPWDIDRYGGYAPLVGLLEHVPTHIKAGHCFPAGHASTGLWLASLAIFCLPQSSKKAAAVFAAGLAAGFAMGWTQQMRGAHFLTHTLWAMWIASALMLLLSWLIFRSWHSGIGDARLIVNCPAKRL